MPKAAKADSPATDLVAAWPALLSVKLLAAYLSISERSAWKLVSSGDLPKPIKIPGMASTRWDREEVDRYRAKWN